MWFYKYANKEFASDKSDVRRKSETEVKWNASDVDCKVKHRSKCTNCINAYSMTPLSCPEKTPLGGLSFRSHFLLISFKTLNMSYVNLKVDRNVPVAVHEQFNMSPGKRSSSSLWPEWTFYSLLFTHNTFIPLEYWCRKHISSCGLFLLLHSDLCTFYGFLSCMVEAQCVLIMFRCVGSLVYGRFPCPEQMTQIRS